MNLTGSNQLREIGEDGRIILKLILQKQVIHTRIGTELLN